MIAMIGWTAAVTSFALLAGAGLLAVERALRTRDRPAPIPGWCGLCANVVADLCDHLDNDHPDQVIECRLCGGRQVPVSRIRVHDRLQHHARPAGPEDDPTWDR